MPLSLKINRKSKVVQPLLFPEMFPLEPLVVYGLIFCGMLTHQHQESWLILLHFQLSVEFEIEISLYVHLRRLYHCEKLQYIAIGTQEEECLDTIKSLSPVLTQMA